MQTITAHWWFDKEAKQAAKLYISIFKDSQVKNTATFHNTPSGTVDLLSIELLAQEFRLINAGSLFKFTPAVSFLVAGNTKDEVHALWKGLSKEGSVLMQLGEYPFSERYGWTQARYGLSRQVMFMGDRAMQQRISPTLMFVDEQCGKAEDAINFYTSVFRHAKVDLVLRCGKDEKPEKEGTIKHAGIVLADQSFAVMDSARALGFTFNEAISFIVRCNTQEEIEYFWSKLSADSKAGQCWWLKDRFGLSRQIVPTVMDGCCKIRMRKNWHRSLRLFSKWKSLILPN